MVLNRRTKLADALVQPIFQQWSMVDWDLKQEDTLHSLLFTLFVDILSRLMKGAARNNAVKVFKVGMESFNLQMNFVLL